jgi:uncharacterized membrane protein
MVIKPHVSVGRIRDIKIEAAQLWQQFKFWQKLFIYFWFLSVIGHFIEVIFIWIRHTFFGAPDYHLIVQTITPMAPPYGIGLVAVILITLPLIKYYKLNPAAVFLVNVFVTGAVEYFCALFIVMSQGYNRFWNYSTEPFNINGYTCLGVSVLFGILATLFIYYIYPLCERTLGRIKPKYLSVFFWVLLIIYVIDNLYSSFK